MILIVLGIAESILTVMDINMPVPVAIVLGIAFICLGAKTLLDSAKNLRR